jgi:hypothetical protein
MSIDPKDGENAEIPEQGEIVEQPEAYSGAPEDYDGLPEYTPAETDSEAMEARFDEGNWDNKTFDLSYQSESDKPQE